MRTNREALETIGGSIQPCEFANRSLSRRGNQRPRSVLNEDRDRDLLPFGRVLIEPSRRLCRRAVLSSSRR